GGERRGQDESGECEERHAGGCERRADGGLRHDDPPGAGRSPQGTNLCFESIVARPGRCCQGMRQCIDLAPAAAPTRCYRPLDSREVAVEQWSGRPTAPDPALSGRGLATPHRVALLVGLLGGLALVFLTPPFEVPDEPAHLLRAYNYAEGAPTATAADGTIGLPLPAGLHELADLTIGTGLPVADHRQPAGSLAAALRLPLAPETRIVIPAHTLVCYPPVTYLPAIAAGAIGAALELRPLFLLYLGRLLTCLAALALCSLAVAIAPFYRWLFAFFALLPMAAFLRSSVSADGMTDAYALLLVAAVLAAAFGRRDHVRRALFLLPALAFAVAASKGYFALPLLVLLIPGERLGPPLRRIAFHSGVLAATALGFAWALAAGRQGSALVPQGEISAPRQLAVVLHDPLAFVALTMRDYGR